MYEMESQLGTLIINYSEEQLKNIKDLVSEQPTAQFGEIPFRSESAETPEFPETDEELSREGIVKIDYPNDVA